MAKLDRLHIGMTRQEMVWGWLYLIFSAGFLPLLLPLMNIALGEILSAAWVNFIYFSVNFAAVAVILRKFLAQSLIGLGKNFLRTLTAAFLGFCVYYVSSTALTGLLIWLEPGFANVNDSAIADMVRTDYIPMLIGTVLLVPVAEETLYRGLILRPLYNKNKAMGFLVSTLLFSAIHVVGYIGSYDPLTLLLCYIQYLPAGICLGWAYIRADNIFAPILIHTVVNAMGIYAVR